MKVFVLSLLAVSSVHSHAIPYPSYHQLVTYEPARGQFPVYNDLNQGYLQYYDHNGHGHQVGYHYPEPLFGLQRYSYSSGIGGNQYLRSSNSENGFSAQSYYQPIESNALEKAREDHFRKWCQTRYQALKAEIEKLRAEGVQPSNDILTQLQPLEKIVTTTAYNDISETPEFKRIHDEHLRIWNEARLRVLQQESDHLRFHGSKQTTSDSTINKESGASNQNANSEQKKVHDGHSYSKTLISDHKTETGKINLKEMHPVQQIQQNVDLKSTLDLQQGLQQQNQHHQHQLLLQVDDTPEVKRAREEHLQAINEAILRAKAEGTYNVNDDGSYKASKYEQSSQISTEHIETNPLLKFRPAVQQPIQPIQNIAIVHTSHPTQQSIQQSQSSILKSVEQTQQTEAVQDTPENMRARDEHLKIFNDLKLSQSIQNNPVVETLHPIQHSQANILKSAIVDTLQQPQQPLPVQDTPEVIRARDEHLKIFNQVKLSLPVENTPVVQTLQPIQHSQATILKTSIVGSLQQPQQPLPVQDTPEVIRARDEHLKIVNEVKLGQPIQNTLGIETLQPSQQSIQLSQGSILKGVPIVTAQLPQQPLPIQDTPEVIRAREEHLRIFNEAKLMAEQHRDTTAHSEKTEVQSALRTHNDQHTAVEVMREEQLQMAAERQREAELELQRQLEEEKLRKMELLREQQRQEEEKHLREAEELQLKLEEEKRRLESNEHATKGLQYQILNQQQKLSSSSSASYSGLSSSSSSITGQSEYKPITTKTTLLQSGLGQGLEGAAGLSSSVNDGSIAVGGSGFVISSQYKNNPYLLRFAAQPGTTAYLISDTQPGLQQITTPGMKYLPAKVEPSAEQNLPLLPQTGLKLQQTQQSIDLGANIAKTNPFLSSGKISTSSSASHSFSSTSSNANLLQSTKTEMNNLAELEKATREHFRAHEIALEQLRLANARDPHHKDC